MSDTTTNTPPKPKPGSLRDRIAAFENKAAAAGTQPPGPPPPRPKPAGFATWKPKQPSPPDSPSSSSTGTAAAAAAAGESPARAGGGAMNAADAKESITRAGGSLKERMAALQGRGAFGAPTSPPVAPKPAAENKPRWKPPPQVASPPPVIGEDDEEVKGKEEEGDTGVGQVPTSPSPPSIKSPPPIMPSLEPRSGSGAVEEEEADNAKVEGEMGGVTEEGADQESGEKEVDEEEEARQKRAAIAARMAKLGGARIGMGPPVFGRPPVPPPSKKPSLPTPAPAELEAKVPKVEEEAPSAESTTAPDTSPRPPSSMPVPAMPKRTAPPRRKPTKSPSIGAVTPEESPVPPLADAPASLVQDDAEAVIPPTAEVDDVIAKVEESKGSTIEEEEERVVLHEDVGVTEPAPEVGAEEGDVTEAKAEYPEETREVQEPQEQAVEEDDDEEARKKRVAERLARMGGVNPFAMPQVPLRRTSVGSTMSTGDASSGVVSPPPPTSPPVPTRKPSRGSSIGLGSPPPRPADKPAGLRRTSAGSVSSLVLPPPSPSGDGGIKRASVGSAEGGVGVGRRASVGSVRSVKREEVYEVQEIVEEPEEEKDLTDVKLPVEAKQAAKRSSIDGEDEEDEIQHEQGSQELYDKDHGFDATPQPPPRVPSIATAGGSSSATTFSRDISNQVDPGLVASVIPPPPAGSPPPTATATATSAHAPLPPRVVSTSRDSSVERLSGPAPPRRLVPQTPEPERRDSDVDEDGHPADAEYERQVEEDEDGEGAGSELTHSALFVPPPVGQGGMSYRTVVDVSEGEESEPPLHVPPPSTGGVTTSVGGDGGRRGAYDDTDTESNASGVPLPIRVTLGSGVGGESIQGVVKPSRSLPPPPLPPMSFPIPGVVEGDADDSGSEYDDEEQQREEGSMLRTRPLSGESESVPLVVPPRLDEGGGVKHAPIRSVPVPPPPPGEEEKEILDEDEGDPIDPSFHSPHSQRASTVYLQAETHTSPRVPETQKPAAPSLSRLSAAVPRPPVPNTEKAKDEGGDEEDVEKVRKQSIAERMARLGGIKFGGAPVPGRPPVPVPVPRKSSGEDQPEVGFEREERVEEEVRDSSGGAADEDEEEERARRERISAKLAGMGGMRIGMMPMAMPPRQSHALRDVPQAPPPPPQKGSGTSESGTSEDGVKVEAEESEIEEVGYEEVKGLEEEEVPPPPPARPANRRGTGASTSSTIPVPTSPPPPTRPPVPVTGPFRRASTTSVKKGQSMHSQPSEYVIVDEPKAIGEESLVEEVPPPPARPTHRAPPPVRAMPPMPATSMGDSISSQWELPTIPSSSFGGDLSASWSEALLDEQQLTPQPSESVPVPVPPPVAAPPPKSPEALHLDSDDLMAVWGRVGVQICEVATTMYDHSKKTLVGDGTYRGFIGAVLSEVPNAAKPQTRQIPYGYLMYLQNGTQVQKRASEIMPGDIVEIVDARFKGHKGLGGYQQHVGTGVEGGEGGGPVLGVVSEFESKKSKVRVFQANQHVGQQTVETASYRLEDLKSGLVKVYRVLEA